ncbi:amidase [Pseudomaricurvus alkylphenolicus]|uniref:amidase family protein n=1 Tax=Pseudomaricurvus alkylphenolicus TaxID=1306991 RepID=UPI0014238F12|nr:amidase [Pseudomaricurvus alkylphenolicus]
MNPLDYDAIGLAQRIKEGEFTPAEVLEASIRACEKINPKINAFSSTRFEKARQEADQIDSGCGPLAGVPMVVKDMVTPEAGEPEYTGSRLLKEIGLTGQRDCHIVACLKKAGVISVGRTNVPEFGSSNGPCSCENEFFGVTRNPWNPEHSTMGSSGGTAAAVAAGIAPIGIGTDAGGSIRLPSSANGLVGLKPSRGRISKGPDLGETFAAIHTQGVMTRSVRDSALALDLVHGNLAGDSHYCPAPQRPYLEELERAPGALRIGVCDINGLGDLHEECRDAVMSAADLLSNLGHRVESAWPETYFQERWIRLLRNIVGTGISQAFDNIEKLLGRPVTEADVEFGTWVDATFGKTLSVADCANTLVGINSFVRETTAWWEGDDGYDLLLSPVIASPPPKLGFIPSLAADRDAIASQVMPFTAQFNITGQPAISLPLAMSKDGLPIGVQLVARYADEATLIRVAAQVEKTALWNDQRAPIREQG